VLEVVAAQLQRRLVTLLPGPHPQRGRRAAAICEKSRVSHVVKFTFIRLGLMHDHDDGMLRSLTLFGLFQHWYEFPTSLYPGGNRTLDVLLFPQLPLDK
jgi:hypothetical protein